VVFPAWEEKKLNQLLDKVIDNRGKTPPVEKLGNPLIEVNAIGKRDIKYKVITKYVSDETYESWFRKHIEEGDVLFSTVGATAQCSYFKNEGLKATIAQNIVGLRFNNSCNGLFMFYLLTEKNNKQKFKSIEMGAVQPSIKVSQMIDLHFNIPSLGEQNRIAKLLSAIDDKINANQSQLELVKQYKQGLLQQMFV
jgi:type I restriction enzyme S subunit